METNVRFNSRTLKAKLAFHTEDLSFERRKVFCLLLFFLLIILCQCVIDTHVLINDTGFQCHQHIRMQTHTHTRTHYSRSILRHASGVHAWYSSMFAVRQYAKH